MVLIPITVANGRGPWRGGDMRRDGHGGGRGIPGGRDMMGGRCIFITGGGEGHAYEGAGRGACWGEGHGRGGAWAERHMPGERN